MNTLFGSSLGALLARPWVDPAGLFGLRRWYFPLSRVWAAANAAGEDVARFRDEVGQVLPGFWTDARLQPLLARNARALRASIQERTAWETAIFDPAAVIDPGGLDRRRRLVATRHLATRGWLYPLLFPRRPPLARWRIDDPGRLEREFGPTSADPAALYSADIDAATVAVSRPFFRGALREYWLRAPTPSTRLRQRAGSEFLYARVVEPADVQPQANLIIGSGLCLELELLTMARDPAAQLAALGWRVIEPISPYHGLRAMPGYYGGEPFFAVGPSSTIDLITGQAIESALLATWCRARFGGPVALAGISMSSFVAQQVASHCHLWPLDARPDAVMLISHSEHIADVTFGGALAAALGIDRALTKAGWSRESLARLSQVIDPAMAPVLPPSRIVSVLGKSDRWLPYEAGLALGRRWKLPEANVFRYPLGHLGMPVQLTRDAAPFVRLMQVLNGR